MEKYRLYTVVPMLLKFLEELTNWYVRLNRPRLKGEVTQNDWIISLNVLLDVILKSAILMDPYVPFITEMIYSNLSKVKIIFLNLITFRVQEKILIFLIFF